MFVDFLKNNQTALELFNEIEFKDISKIDVNNIINKIPIDVDNKEDISNKIYQRYSFLKNIFNK